MVIRFMAFSSGSRISSDLLLQSDSAPDASVASLNEIDNSGGGDRVDVETVDRVDMTASLSEGMLGLQ